MKTIAAQAGVTQATVSMSLANNPRIPPATRERIQAIARQLGYHPNPYVSTLMRIRRQGKPLKDKPALALVCGHRSPDGWRNNPAPTIRQMREGAIERATYRGYRAQEFWLHRDDMSNERFSEMLHARGIQGLLIGPMAEGEPPPALRWEYFAAVCLSVPLPSLTITTVCNDHYFSSLQAVRECHRRGYRRPGLVLRKAHQNRFQGRWEAGFGIAREMLPHVFEMFVQGGSTLERAQGGLGIGLTLVRQLVEMHGGSVSAQSAGPGHGSTFTIVLPVASQPRASGPDRGAEPPAAPTRLQVLVADDNQDAAATLATLLELMGHACTAVHDGAVTRVR